MEIQNTKVVVTGSARRVGRHIALHLARNGADVVIHYNSSDEEAMDLRAEIENMGRDSYTVQADISNLDEVKDLIDEANRKLDGIDVLVNNASIFPKTPIEEITPDDWSKNIDINLRAPFFASLYTAEKMDSGKIISIADWSAFRPYRNYLPYCISKAGIVAMTKGLAKELAPEINVNAVAPGPVLLPEDFTEDEKQSIIEETPLNRIGSPEDIAKGIRFLMESDFMTGSVIPIDGGRLIE